jgi:hypothetical protein
VEQDAVSTGAGAKLVAAALLVEAGLDGVATRFMAVSGRYKCGDDPGGDRRNTLCAVSY